MWFNPIDYRCRSTFSSPAFSRTLYHLSCTRQVPCAYKGSASHRPIHFHKAQQKNCTEEKYGFIPPSLLLSSELRTNAQPKLSATECVHLYDVRWADIELSFDFTVICLMTSLAPPPSHITDRWYVVLRKQHFECKHRGLVGSFWVQNEWIDWQHQVWIH